MRTSALGIGQTVRLGTRNNCVVKEKWKFIFIWFYDFLFFICFLLHFMCSIFQELPSDGDFLGSLLLAWSESPPESRLLKLLQHEAPATIGERWGRVGRMMTREWLLCHWGCVESGWKRHVESHEGRDCFKIWEINKQIQMKWFLFFFLKKDYLNR